MVEKQLTRAFCFWRILIENRSPFYLKAKISLVLLRIWANAFFSCSGLS